MGLKIQPSAPRRVLELRRDAERRTNRLSPPPRLRWNKFDQITGTVIDAKSSCIALHGLLESVYETVRPDATARGLTSNASCARYSSMTACADGLRIDLLVEGASSSSWSVKRWRRCTSRCLPRSCTCRLIVHQLGGATLKEGRAAFPAARPPAANAARGDAEAERWD
jgi:hypothetical protein